MPEEVKHTRKVYGWIDLLGDLGGVTEVIMIVFGFFLFPISEHSFFLKAIKKLYLVRTEDNSMFLPNNDEKLAKFEKFKEKIDDPEVKEEVEKHRFARLKFSDSVKLYLANSLGVLFCNCCWSKKEKYQRLYEKGQEKIESELDIVRLTKNLRYMKILLRNSLMSRRVKFDIMHQEKNLIDVSNDEDEAEAEELEVQTQRSSAVKGDLDGPDTDDDKATVNPDEIMTKLRKGKRLMSAKK